MFKLSHFLYAFLLSMIGNPTGVGYAAQQIFKREQALGVFCNKSEQRREMLLERAAEIGLPAYLVYHNSKIDQDAESITNVGILSEGRIIRSQAIHPIPTVVYRFNFVSTRPIQAENFRKISLILKNRNVKYINPNSSHILTRNKFRFSKVLSKQGVRHPVTMELSSENLASLLAKFNTVFVKPVFGNHGNGIVIVSKNVDVSNRFDLSYRLLGVKGEYVKFSQREVELSQISDLIEEAKVEMGTYDSRYIVQEGIDVYIYEGKTSEVRALTVRAEDGKLCSPIIVAKIGGNRCSGGILDDFGVLSSSIAKQIGIPKSTIENAVKKCASQLHLAIEEEIGEKCGDLGHDIAIDSNGNVEVIESNVKSGQFVAVSDKGICCDKNLFGSLSWIVFALDLQSKRDKSIAEYALHLSKSSSESYLN